MDFRRKQGSGPPNWYTGQVHMGLRMASPWKHPETGTYYLRERVPLALLPQVRGRKVVVPVNGRHRAVTLGEVVKVSLGTKEPKVAKVTYRDTAAAVEGLWQRLRQEAVTGPVRLTGQQVEALAGQYYGGVIHEYGDDPGPADASWDDAIDADRGLSKKGRERIYGAEADRLLQNAALAVDEDSRARLLEAINRASIDAHLCLQRRAYGDYSPDPIAGRFPDLRSPFTEAAEPRAIGAVTLSNLFDLWKADHLLEGGSPKTVRDFRQKLDTLADFLGHEDVDRITPRLISDWTEHLRHGKGLTARTVAGKHLATVKRVFTVGKRKHRINDNPAAEVTVEVRKTVRERSPGFTEQEAEVILSAALKAPEGLGRMAENNKRAIRWGPWICAYTGARIAEIMQLRKLDVETHEGIPCIRITPEAGSTKTESQRLVPIHPHLVEQGFLDFVRSRPDSYLFFTPKPGDNPVTRAGNVGKKVSGWVRETVGIKDGRVQPNHAWRHRFKTEARRLSIERWIVDAIQGHEDGTASKNYGEVPVRPLYEAIRKMPKYKVV